MNSVSINNLVLVALLGLATIDSSCQTEVLHVPGAQCSVSLRVFTPPYQEAFAGVSSLRFTLKLSDGQIIEHVVDRTASEFFIDGPPSLDTVMQVEGLDIDGIAIASGQSAPFDLLDGETSQVDILFSKKGEMTQLLGRLNHPRFGHTASILPDGRILVFGGASKGDLNNPMDFPPPEIYDPRIQTSCGFGDFDCPVFAGADRRIGHSATSSADGRVLVFGGMDSEHKMSSKVLMFDSQQGSFRQLTGFDPQRVKARVYHSAVTMQVEDPGTAPYRQAILISGGISDLENGTVSDNALLFDTRLETFFDTDLKMRRPRSHHTMTVFGTERRLLVAAGGEDEQGLVPQVEMFNGISFEDISPAGQGASGSLSTPRTDHVALEVPSGVLLIGGQDGLVSLDNPELFAFNSSLGTGVFTLEIAASHSGHTSRSSPLAVVESSGDVLLAGGELKDGFDTTLEKSAEMFIMEQDSANASFIEAAPLPEALAHAAHVQLSGGEYLFIGGLKSGQDGVEASDEIWCYNPR